jgi:Kelch motif protein
MGSDAKSPREPRGVLLVPVLKDEVIQETRGPEVVDEVESPPPLPVVVPTPSSRRPLRVVGFVALLVALALAGLIVGRAARDSGGEEAAAPQASTPAPSTPAPKPAAPVAQPKRERWGPLEVVPAGRLAVRAPRPAATLADGRLVVLGPDAVQLGPPGRTLRRAAALPATRAGGAAFATSGGVYLIGGEPAGGTPSDQILRIDPASGRVRPVGPFIEPLAGAGYVRARNGLLIAGGWTGEKYATAVLRLAAPEQEPTLVARLPEGVRDPAVASVGGKLYVAGGRTASGPTDVVYVVELATGGVTVLGRLPKPVSGAVLVGAEGKLYVLGGRSAKGPVATVTEIDPATERITPAGTMPRPLAGAVAVPTASSTLVLGGDRLRPMRVRGL